MQKTNLPRQTQYSSKSEKAAYQKTILANGIRVVSETIPHVRSVSLGVWADVGSRDEADAQNGISHFLEHMVFKGTKKRNVREIAQSLEALGGYLNAFTTKDHTCFYARVLDLHVTTAMDVLADLVLNATFNKKELEREKLVVIEEMRNAEDNPEDIIHDYFEKALFPSHPLGNPIIGTEENVRRFGRPDLEKYVDDRYRPERLVVAAAGNIEHDSLVRLVDRMFRSLKASSHSTNREPSPHRKPKNTFVEHQKAINQAHVCLGTVAHGVKHKDRYPLLVMNTLLGEGMSSRLYQNIRERYGFAYSVYSYVNMFSDTGVFGAYVGTDKKNVQNARELIIKELSKLKAKLVSRAELERTKAQIKGTMMLGLENMSGRMMRLGSTELYFGSFASLDTIIGKIDAVTPEAIQKVARDLFNEKEISTVVIRPS